MPKTWGFVLRASDLQTLARRRFVVRLSTGASLFHRPPAPPPVPPPLPPRRRR